MLSSINSEYELWGFIDGDSIEITDLLLSKQRVSEIVVNQGAVWGYKTAVSH